MFTFIKLMYETAGEHPNIAAGCFLLGVAVAAILMLLGVI